VSNYGLDELGRDQPIKQVIEIIVVHCSHSIDVCGSDVNQRLIDIVLAPRTLSVMVRKIGDIDTFCRPFSIIPQVDDMDEPVRWNTRHVNYGRSSDEIRRCVYHHAGRSRRVLNSPKT
jgi:hypothetical protein